MQPKNQLQGVQLWPSMLFFQVWSEYGDYRDKITQTILNLKSEQTQPIESRIAMSANCPISAGGSYKDAGNRYVHPHFDPPLENGLLLIFPSHLLHSGLPYFGNKPRIVIAFNAQVHLRQSPQTVRVTPED